MRHPPHHPLLAFSWRDALDQVGVGGGDNAGKHSKAEPRADRGHHPHGRAVMNDPAVVETEILKPGGVSAPQLGPSSADERVLLQLVAGSRHTVLGGVIVAAI